MRLQISIQDEFSPALLRAFDDSRLRPDIVKAVNQIMKMWVSFAIAKIPAAKKDTIKSYLDAPATRSKWRRGSIKARKKVRISQRPRYEMLRRSLAAHIVWATNYKGARDMTAEKFYATVGKYMGARQYSRGYLKSGLYPALNAFRARLGQSERTARYKRPAGEAKKAEKQEAIPTAEVQDWAEGILKVAPEAFTASLPEITREVQKWIAQNLAERAEREGLSAKTY